MKVLILLLYHTHSAKPARVTNIQTNILPYQPLVEDREMPDPCDMIEA